MSLNSPAASPISFWKGLRPALPATIFPPGWFLFCLRTWLSAVLALSTAFWLQLSSPGSAAVTVMILAQPLRGQVLSKAVYRLMGTMSGRLSPFSSRPASIRTARFFWAGWGYG